MTIDGILLGVFTHKGAKMRYKSVQTASGCREKFDAEIDELLADEWHLHEGTLIAFDSAGKITSYFQALVNAVPGIDEVNK